MGTLIAVSFSWLALLAVITGSWLVLPVAGWLVWLIWSDR